MMLAETTTPDPKAFFQFWLIIGFLASIFSNLVVAAVVLMGRKQKREVSFTFDAASKEEFLKHVADNDNQRGLLHKRIDDVIDDYNAKFQSLPNEIVALLKNTGAIRR